MNACIHQGIHDIFVLIKGQIYYERVGGEFYSALL